MWQADGTHNRFVMDKLHLLDALIRWTHITCEPGCTIHGWTRWILPKSITSKAVVILCMSMRPKKYKKKKLKQTNVSAHLVQSNIHEGSPEGIKRLWRKGFVKQTSYTSGVKGRGSDRWWEQRLGLWWSDVCKMRWTRTRGEWTGWGWQNEEGSWFHR